MTTAGSNHSLFAPRLPLILPQSDDPALQQIVRLTTQEMNKLPMMSVFSFSSPNSNLTAQRSTWGQNIASGASVFWIKQIGSGNTGWVALA